MNKIPFLFFRAVNLLMLSFGSTIGWLSPSLPLLQSEASPLSSGPMTTEQISWTGSLLSPGAIVGNILGGYLMARFGSKMILMSLAVPQLVFSLQCINEPCVCLFFLLWIMISNLFVGILVVDAIWNCCRAPIPFEICFWFGGRWHSNGNDNLFFGNLTRQHARYTRYQLSIITLFWHTLYIHFGSLHQLHSTIDDHDCSNTIICNQFLCHTTNTTISTKNWSR